MFENICLKQIRTAVAFFAIALLLLKLFGFLEFKESKIGAQRVEEYGVFFSVILYSLKMISFITIPFNLQFLICTLYYKQEKLLTTPPSLPKDCLCFRIVTRGDYPKMVKTNIDTLLNLMKKFEFSNYLIEVVTNKPINVPREEKVREVVVPDEYKTKNGSKYKARY